MKHLYVDPTWRRFANIAVIIAASWVTIIVLWSPEAAGPRQQEVEVDSQTAWFYALAIAGPLAYAAVFVALRHAMLARLLLLGAAASLFIGLIGFQAFGTLAWGTLIIPGIIMLAAVPFMGPMPTPEQEGGVRKPIGKPDGWDAWDPDHPDRQKNEPPAG